MDRLNVLLGVALVCVASTLASVVDPRGARPVEPATRGDKCDTKREWPFCTDDNWGPKCPSGCRIQGLIDKYDHDALKKIEKIRGILDQNRAKHRSTDLVSKQTYDFLREKLIVDAGNDNNYYELAQSLRQRITDMKIKIDRQLRILATLKDQVKDQVADMQRLEIDIDIKLRSCKGSCQSYSEHRVDQDSYVELDKQIVQLDSQSAQSVESVGTLFVMKSQPLEPVQPGQGALHKSKDLGDSVAAQQPDVFSEVGSMRFIIEEEGSSKATPATISKTPGTSSSSSSRSITELGGPGDSLLGFGAVSTSHRSSTTVTCTKSVRRTIDHTKDGLVEEVHEVFEGGPECQAMNNGGATSTSTSSFISSGTKTVFTGNTKSGSADPIPDPFGLLGGSDFGQFKSGPTDDDLPDFRARSVKSARVERQADYVGKVCLRLRQQSQADRPSASYAPSYRTEHCGARPAAALCSHDDWVFKCPSGCRLQGLILQTEVNMDKKLRQVCKTAKMYEDAAARSMATTARVYNHNRRVIVSRHMSELKFVEQAEGLTKKLTALRRRSSRLSLQLDELHANVQKQMEDVYQAEVDVDMRLRACSGSCRRALPFSVDHLSHQKLRADMEQIDETLQPSRTAATPPKDVKDVPHIRLQPVDVGPAPAAEYKTIPTVQRELLTQFEDIGQNRVGLEELLEAE